MLDLEAPAIKPPKPLERYDTSSPMLTTPAITAIASMYSKYGPIIDRAPSYVMSANRDTKLKNMKTRKAVLVNLSLPSAI